MNNFLKNFRDFVIKNKNLSYNELTYTVLKQYNEQFLDPDFVVTIDENVSNLFLIFSPLMHVFDENHKKHKRMLFKINNEILVEDEDKLNCVGDGYIGTNGIMVVGMAPGFYNDNKFDKLSKPFKPSFYFALTSKMLREGFKSHLKRIYFTNLSKLCLSRKLMDDKSYNNNYSYENMYEKYLHVLKEEINILKPKTILSLGRDVFNFMNENGIESTYTYHPSYFCYKKQFEIGKKHYQLKIKELLED
jgi:uracil-DNA glycosylase